MYRSNFSQEPSGNKISELKQTYLDKQLQIESLEKEREASLRLLVEAQRQNNFSPRPSNERSLLLEEARRRQKERMLLSEPESKPSIFYDGTEQKEPAYSFLTYGQEKASRLEDERQKEEDSVEFKHFIDKEYMQLKQELENLRKGSKLSGDSKNNFESGVPSKPQWENKFKERPTRDVERHMNYANRRGGEDFEVRVPIKKQVDDIEIRVPSKGFKGKVEEFEVETKSAWKNKAVEESGVRDNMKIVKEKPDKDGRVKTPIKRSQEFENRTGFKKSNERFEVEYEVKVPARKPQDKSFDQSHEIVAKKVPNFSVVSSSIDVVPESSRKSPITQRKHIDHQDPSPKNKLTVKPPEMTLSSNTSSIMLFPTESSKEPQAVENTFDFSSSEFQKPVIKRAQWNQEPTPQPNFSWNPSYQPYPQYPYQYYQYPTYAPIGFPYPYGPTMNPHPQSLVYPQYNPQFIQNYSQFEDNPQKIYTEPQKTKREEKILTEREHHIAASSKRDQSKDRRSEKSSLSSSLDYVEKSDHKKDGIKEVESRKSEHLIEGERGVKVEKSSHREEILIQRDEEPNDKKTKHFKQDDFIEEIVVPEIEEQKKAVLIEVGVKQTKTLAQIFKEKNKIAAAKIHKREDNIPKLDHVEKTKEELIEIRKNFVKAPKIEGKKNDVLEFNLEEKKNFKEPSSSLMERLANGKRVKVSKEEMLKLNKKNYQMLPEVKKKQEEEKKKQEKQARMMKAKEYEKERLMQRQDKQKFKYLAEY